MSAWDHIEITCYRDDCGAPIALHRGHYDRLRESHATFYCPAGHGQHFAGKSETEKRIDELERDLESTEKDLRNWQANWDNTRDVAAALIRGAQACPLGCGWSTSRRLNLWWLAPDDPAIGRFLDRVGHDLAEHLQHAHHATPGVVAGLLTAGAGEGE